MKVPICGSGYKGQWMSQTCLLILGINFYVYLKEDLKEFYGKIITRNDENELKGRCDVKSTVHVYGDLFVTGLLNGQISIPDLKFNTVTKKEDQNLKGKLHIFNGSFNFHGSF